MMGTALVQQFGRIRQLTRAMSATERGSRTEIGAHREEDRRAKWREGTGRAAFFDHGIRFVVRQMRYVVKFCLAADKARVIDTQIDLQQH